jgi:hypothetical protein
VCRDGNLKALRRSAKMFDSLCRASSEINDIFSAPVLFLLTTKFISVVTHAFIYIYSFIHENAVLESGNVAFPLVFITDWSRILVILASADLPVNQVSCLFKFSLVYIIIIIHIIGNFVFSENALINLSICFRF